MSQATQRDRAVDWARGVAALAMIEGHALHGWASDAARETTAYGWTRLLATTPLPAFMLLAGMALRLRIGVAETRREAPAALRRGVLWRGLQVVLWGYAASAGYALLDGHNGLRTFLRADVLHVIGLSIACMPLLCVAPDRPIDAAAATRRALWLSVAIILLSPVYYAAVPPTAYTGPLRYLLAPFVRVPGVSIFPLLPMMAWTSIGFVAAHFIVLARRRWSLAQVYGATAALSLGLACLCELTTRALLGDAGVLDDVHPAGIPNMIGYAARGLVLVGVGPLLVMWLPEAARAMMTRLGRASLIAYVFHIPFCYGLPARPLRNGLEMLESIPYVLLLWVVSYLAVLAWGGLVGAVRALSAWPQPRPAQAPSG